MVGACNLGIADRTLDATDKRFGALVFSISMNSEGYIYR